MCDKIYTHEYYESHRSNEKCYEHIAEYLKEMNVTSITDYGCGHCILVEKLIKLDIDAYGLEMSDNAKHMWITTDKYQIIDFTTDIEIMNICKTEYVISTEVAEHIEQKHANNFIKCLILHKPLKVFFSAATYFQDMGCNSSHVNEQPMQYWVDIFNQHEYEIDILECYKIKKYFGENMDIYKNAWWYPKNMLVFKPKCICYTNEDILKIINISDIDHNPKIYSSNLVRSIILSRDYYEYKNIIMKLYTEYCAKYIKILISESGMF